VSTIGTEPAGFAGDGFDELDEHWLRSRPGVKWRAVGHNVLPCWIADMDFPSPHPVRQALAQLAAGGDLGYRPWDQAEVLEQRWANRMWARYGWLPRTGQLRPFTELVQAVEAIVHFATSPGDGVVLLTPSYPPFVEAIEQAGRRLLAVPALAGPQGWAFDLDAAARAAAQARALVLVNPHNPTGRMLSRSELMVLGQLAEHYDLLVVSDEVHADLALAGGRRHVPFASLSEELARRTVTLYSASKSYNLGGMGCAIAHIGHPAVARALDVLPTHLLGGVGAAAVTATLAAWSPEGDAWLERCLVRLRHNRQALAAWLCTAGAASGVAGFVPDATYLAWLDLRATALDEDPAAWLLRQARVKLNSGPTFGPGGAGFARLNFATTPGLLTQALDRIAQSLAERPGRPSAGPASGR
jgi:cystathionine beta-lyase